MATQKETVLIDLKIEGTENESKINALSAAINELTEENKKLAAANKELSKAGKDNSDEISRNSSQIAINKQKITEANASRKGLIETIKAEDNSIKALSVRNIELRKQRDLINTSTDEGRKRIAAINAELDKNNKIIKQNNDALGQQKINVGNYASALNGVKTAALSLGSALIGGLGIYAVADAIKSGLRVIKEFEVAMSTLKAISGATAEQFKMLEKNALDLGASTRYTATQVAQLQIEFSKLGFSTEEILAATEATLNLATATGSDLARSAEIAGSTLRAFQLDASEMGRVTDVMASGFNTSALGLDNFAESIKFVAPVAKAVGVSIEETTAYLAVLADAGIKGSNAGTALRKIFTQLTADGRPLAERMDELAKKGVTLADANDEVGLTAQTSLLILGNQNERVKELTKTYEGANGETAKMAAIMEDNLQGSITKLSSAWDGWILSLSSSSGYLRELTDDLTQMVNLLTNDELAKQITEGRGWFAKLFPNIDQLLNLDEYNEGIEDLKSTNQEYIKITTEGFIKVPETFEQMQERINKQLVKDLELKKQKLQQEKELEEKRAKEQKELEEKRAKDGANRRAESESIAIEQLKIQELYQEESIELTTTFEQAIKDVKDKFRKENAEAEIKQTEYLIAYQKEKTKAQLFIAGQLAVGLASLFERGSAAAKAAALIDIAVNTALGFIQGLDIAQKGAKATGPAAPFAFPIFYATQVAAVLGAAGRARAVISQAAGGGNFITNGPTMLLVGDNPGGRERISVEPLSGRGETKINPASGLIQMAGGGTIITGSEIRTAYGQAQSTASMANLMNQVKTVLVLQDFEAVQMSRNNDVDRATVVI